MRTKVGNPVDVLCSCGQMLHTTQAYDAVICDKCGKEVEIPHNVELGKFVPAATGGTFYKEGKLVTADGKEVKREMMDLVYLGEMPAVEAFMKEVKEKFPTFKMDKEWDEIHEWRVSVSFESTDNKEYFLWLFRNGWAGASFIIQISMYEKKEERVSGFNEAADIFLAERKKKEEEKDPEPQRTQKELDYQWDHDKEVTK